ncbi:hypothetical protein [Phenylobacterium sp.]|uniref:hypothetical protein n=1 Tax=Phenylobacterium sp. TaxID=1871053 RepID=UPI00271D54C5|nr:hypothetical protein [Phenylobacterium sp.]MDO8378267.1 hypothetical protein [Phenylobacterium sp.]
MDNDLTILRLHSEVTDTPEIRATTLGEIAGALENLAAHAKSIFGIHERGPGSSPEIMIAGPPRRGSLEFLLRPELHLTVELTVEAIVGLVPLPSKPEEWLPALADIGTFGMFVWVVLFGQRGVMERRMDREPFDLSRPSAEASSMGLRLALSSVILRDAGSHQFISAIINSAAKAGVSRVEIQLPDEPPVTLFHTAERRRKGLVGMRSRDRNTVPTSTGEPEQFVRKDGPAGDMRFVYQERTLQGFVATLLRESNEVLVLWGSSYEIPAAGNVFWATGEYVDPLEIQPLDDVPQILELIGRVLLVKQSATFK